MKTLITTFAIAVMVFAFNANPVMAGEKAKEKLHPDNVGDAFEDFGNVVKCGFEGKGPNECENRVPYVERDSDEADNDREVADSGNEGSTSSASANDQ